MGRLTIDTTEALSFDPIEPGVYAATVDEISDVETGPKARYVWVHFKLDDPNVARKAGRLRRILPIEGKGSGFFRSFWKAATGEDIPMDTQIDVDTDDAIGRPVMLQVSNETFEGELQNVIDRVSPAS